MRIYVDNVTPDKDDTNSTIPDTGDYKVARFTWYMMVCPVYLPIVSWVTYIILNKLWFYEVYSAINQLSNGADRMPERHSWNKKLLAFLKNPLAYIAAVVLIVSSVAFTAGTYLMDVKDSEVALSTRSAIEGLGMYFIIFFALANLQSVIIFVIVLLAVAAVTLCGLPVLCVVLCYICYYINTKISKINNH